MPRRARRWRGAGKRPENVPDDITEPWPNISYRDTDSCQARIRNKGREYSKTFYYADYGWDVLKAHRAAERWVKPYRKNRLKPDIRPGYKLCSVDEARENTTGVGGVCFVQSLDSRSGLYRYAYQANVASRKNQQFGCGNENTWTPERDAAAFDAAVKARRDGGEVDAGAAEPSTCGCVAAHPSPANRELPLASTLTTSPGCGATVSVGMSATSRSTVAAACAVIGRPTMRVSDRCSCASTAWRSRKLRSAVTAPAAPSCRWRPARRRTPSAPTSGTRRGSRAQPEPCEHRTDNGEQHEADHAPQAVHQLLVVGLAGLAVELLLDAVELGLEAFLDAAQRPCQGLVHGALDARIERDQLALELAQPGVQLREALAVLALLDHKATDALLESRERRRAPSALAPRERLAQLLRRTGVAEHGVVRVAHFAMAFSTWREPNHHSTAAVVM